MKPPSKFTIYDLRFTIGKKSSAVSNRQSSIANRKSTSGIALVITLIMLAVTLVMAVAFLAVARRERNAVTTSTDTATARLAADTALAAVQAQVVANILATTNPYNYSLLVSTNYQNGAGYFTGVVNPTNVNYDFYNSSGVGPISGNDLIQNIANLYLLPRPPVYVYNRNGATNDFRYYLDLNRNARFEANGRVTNVDNLGIAILDASNNPVVTSLTGDPEWVGVLERPDQPHGPNNKFLARYAFLAQPVGNTLDLNYIHNQTRNANPATMSSGDGFFRNESVGSWELNLAAFLADLNTNTWGQDVGLTTSFYQYNQAGIPVAFPNSGVAFQDAFSLLAWRYNYNYNTLAVPPANLYNALVGAGVDGYTLGILMTNTALPLVAAPLNGANAPWAGSDNTNRFFNLVSDVFDTSKTQPSVVAPLIGFTDRLTAAGTNTFSGTTIPTYDRYTFYRMLDELGTDTAADDGRMNVNYSNAVVRYNASGEVTNITIVPGAETNVVPWAPLDFFTAAADRMLRTYTTNWLAANRRQYTNTFGASVTNAFGVANIPVYIDGQFVYSPAVNRILQLAANLYDATTTNFYPSVFRPTFTVVNQNGFRNVYIDGYREVLSLTTFTAGTAPLDTPTNIYSTSLALDADLTTTNGNAYGVPWIIGAKKGLPNFNEFAMENALTVTRRLQLTRTTNTTPPTITGTNQMYLMNLSSSIGVELWNSYDNKYPGTIVVGIHESATITITNDEQNPASPYPYLFQQTFSTNHTTVPLAAWTGSQGSQPYWAQSTGNPATGAIKTVIFTGPTMPYSVYRSPYGAMPSGSGLFVPGFEPTNYLNYYNPGTLNNFETNSPNGFHFPQFGVLVTNRLQVFMIDTTSNRIIDYVSFAGPEGGFNVNSNLADPDLGNNGAATYGVWNTNYPNNSSPPNGATWGILSQITASKSVDASAPADEGGKRGWVSDPEAKVFGTATTDQTAAFRSFLKTSGGLPLAMQAPYSPTRTVSQYFSWQANDPLVHYLASDISSIPPNSDNTKYPNLGVGRFDPPNVLTPLSGLNLGYVNDRYMPWSGNHRNQLATMDTNRFNLTERDPLVQQSDNWDFPAGKLPSIGWLGRVHRGTPWQTVYLKSTDILTNDGVAVWKDWMGNGNTFDATNAAPVQDARLFDLFSTAPNANATHGTLSVNQTHLAAWSAVLSGLTVPNNLTGGYTNIPPAGADAGNSAVGLILNGTLGINATRANFTNTDGVIGAFEHVGDIVRTPALTEQSPFLTGLDKTTQISDALYEWLPQQTLELLRASSTPRYVVYCYGQTLRPAPNGVVTTGGNTTFGLVTNYQVTAESAARAVIRVDNATTNAPRVVIESYTPLPPN
ncbi:MAG: hypothetical protein WCK57_03775 [Verrucomicrobiae bacterium]